MQASRLDFWKLFLSGDTLGKVEDSGLEPLTY